jgi:hypothetical protein
MARHRWRTVKPNAAARARKQQYNSREYRQARAAAKRLVEAGAGYCWRCGGWLQPGRMFHLGHDDNDRTIIRGPECPSCNLTAAGRKGARISNRRSIQRWAL